MDRECFSNETSGNTVLRQQNLVRAMNHVNQIMRENVTINYYAVCTFEDELVLQNLSGFWFRIIRKGDSWKGNENKPKQYRSGIK